MLSAPQPYLPVHRVVASVLCSHGLHLQRSTRSILTRSWSFSTPNRLSSRIRPPQVFPANRVVCRTITVNESNSVNRGGTTSSGKGEAVVFLGSSGKAGALNTMLALERSNSSFFRDFIFESFVSPHQKQSPRPYDHTDWHGYHLLNTPDVSDKADQVQRILTDLHNHLTQTGKPIQAIFLVIDFRDFTNDEPPAWVTPVVKQLHSTFGPDIWRHVGILFSNIYYWNEWEQTTVNQRADVVRKLIVSNTSIPFHRVQSMPCFPFSLTMGSFMDDARPKGFGTSMPHSYRTSLLNGLSNYNGETSAKIQTWLSRKDSFDMKKKEASETKSDKATPETKKEPEASTRPSQSWDEPKTLAQERASLTEKAESLFGRERALVEKGRLLAQREADIAEKEAAAQQLIEEADQRQAAISSQEDQLNKKKFVLEQKEREASANDTRVQKLAEELQAKERELVEREKTLEKRSAELELAKQHLADDRKEAEQLLQEAVRKESRASELESVAELRLRDAEQTQSDANAALIAAKTKENEVSVMVTHNESIRDEKLKTVQELEAKASKMMEDAQKAKQDADALSEAAKDKEAALVAKEQALEQKSQEEKDKKKKRKARVVTEVQPQDEGTSSKTKQLSVVLFLLIFAVMLSVANNVRTYKENEHLREYVNRLADELRSKEKEVVVVEKKAAKAQAERKLSLFALALSWVWQCL